MAGDEFGEGLLGLRTSDDVRGVMPFLGPLLLEVCVFCFNSSALMPITDARLLPAIIRASSIVFARSRSRGTRWLRRPMRWASSASTMRAVNKSSLAIGQPTWFGKVQVLLIRP